jgi:hypothetical protein
MMDSRVLLCLSSENPNEIQKSRSEQDANVTPLTAHDRTEVSKKAIWEDTIGRSDKRGGQTHGVLDQQMT